MSLILQIGYILQHYNGRAYIKSMHVCNFRVAGLITEPYASIRPIKSDSVFQVSQSVNYSMMSQLNVYDGVLNVHYKPVNFSGTKF